MNRSRRGVSSTPAIIIWALAGIGSLPEIHALNWPPCTFKSRLTLSGLRFAFLKFSRRDGVLRHEPRDDGEERHEIGIDRRVAAEPRGIGNDGNARLGDDEDDEEVVAYEPLAGQADIRIEGNSTVAVAVSPVKSIASTGIEMGTLMVANSPLSTACFSAACSERASRLTSSSVKYWR